TQVQFDALNDTARAAVAALDSLNVAITNPALAFGSSDSVVATVDSTGLVRGHSNGAATITARSTSGVVTAIPVTVAQRVARLTVAKDSLRFDALRAVLPAAVVGRDRLGSAVVNAQLG